MENYLNTQEFRKVVEVITAHKFKGYDLEEDWYWLFDRDNSAPIYVANFNGKYHLMIEEEVLFPLGKLSEKIHEFREEKEREKYEEENPYDYYADWEQEYRNSRGL